MRNRIRDLREDRDLKQDDLAREVGIDQRTISNYETGKTKPDSEALIKLADFFGVSIDFLVGRTSYNVSTNQERIKLIDKIKRALDELK